MPRPPAGLLARELLLLRTPRPYLALGAGVLVTLSLPPYNSFRLAWVALVPLLLAAEDLDFRIARSVGRYFGLGFMLPLAHLAWSPVPFWPVLAVLIADLVGVVLGLAAIAGGVFPRPARLLAFPLTWATFEFLQQSLPYVKEVFLPALALSQWKEPAILRVASLTGTTGLTFLILVVNASIAQALVQAKTRAGELARAAIALGLSLLVLGGAYLYGSAAIGAGGKEKTLRVAAIQESTALRPEFKAINDAREYFPRIIGAYDEATSRSLTGRQVDIVVWPETASGVIGRDEYQRPLEESARKYGSYLVVTALEKSEREGRPHIAAALFTPAGNLAGTYRKHHLVPFSERPRYWPGRGCPTFEVGPGRVGLAICYDMNFPEVARNLAGNGAEILLVPWNDGGFPGGFSELHRSFAVLRAAENGIPVVVAAETGVSQVVDGRGRVLAEVGAGEAGVAYAQVPLRTGTTLYTRLGNWFGWLLLAVNVGVLVAGLARKRRVETLSRPGK